MQPKFNWIKFTIPSDPSNATAIRGKVQLFATVPSTGFDIRCSVLPLHKGGYFWSYYPVMQCFDVAEYQWRPVIVDDVKNQEPCHDVEGAVSELEGHLTDQLARCYRGETTVFDAWRRQISERLGPKRYELAANPPQYTGTGVAIPPASWTTTTVAPLDQYISQWSSSTLTVSLPGGISAPVLSAPDSLAFTGGTVTYGAGGTISAMGPGELSAGPGPGCSCHVCQGYYFGSGSTKAG